MAINPERDDARRAIDGAEGILKDSRVLPVKMALRTAYFLGDSLVMSVVGNRMAAGNKELKDPKTEIIDKLTQVIPIELIKQGTDEFSGDLDAEVEVPLSYEEIDAIGRSALSIPSGRRIIESLPIDPNDRAELESFRNKHLQAALAVQRNFIAVGGRNNKDLIEDLERGLS